MNQIRWISAVSLIGLFVIIGTVQAQEQTKKDEKSEHQHQGKDAYACPMHPEVKSDKPGKCPKCGMNLTFLKSEHAKAMEDQSSGQETASENIKEAKRLLATAKGQLMREGKYSCCVEVPCNQCAFDHQSCPCYDNLKHGKPVCNECYSAWQRGEGRDKDINPKDVETTFGTHKH